MKTICIANQKGGVAKTTTTVTVASLLSLQGKRVLLVDADPQGNATMHLGLNPEEYSGLCEVLVGDAGGTKRPLSEVIEHTPHGLDVVPPPLSTIELRLMGIMAGRENLLGKALATVAHLYDIVVIDSPPHMGLLQVNALLASQSVLIPFQAELFGSRSLREFAKTLKGLEEGGAKVPVVVGMLPTRLKSQAPMLSKNIIEKVREIFGAVTLPMHIREAVAVAEAASSGKPLPLYAPDATATQDYRAVVEYLTERGVF